MSLLNRKRELFESPENLCQQITCIMNWPLVVAEIVSRTTISLPDSMLIEIEDLARDNKRNGTGPKTVSAIAREAFNIYLKSMNLYFTQGDCGWQGVFPCDCDIPDIVSNFVIEHINQEKGANSSAPFLIYHHLINE